MTRTRAESDHRSDGAPQHGVDWWSGPSLRLHAAMLIGVSGALAAGWYEWTRARAGHEIAWVYTFEWPLFAVMGVYLWWRLLHGDTPTAHRERWHPRRPRSGSASDIDATDAGLLAWQDYLERLHAADPPGGPPSRS